MARRASRSSGDVFVGREHRDDHAIVRLVAVERLDDPVAPVPDVRLAVADLLAPAGPVAVPPDVHPVPAPALAVPRAGQQAIDDLLVGVGDCVGQEGMKLVGRGRQAGQIEVQPAQEHRPARLGPRRQAARRVLGGDEGIDRVSDPAAGTGRPGPAGDRPARTDSTDIRSATARARRWPRGPWPARRRPAGRRPRRGSGR